jgi:hypothetical protein
VALQMVSKVRNRRSSSASPYLLGRLAEHLRNRQRFRAQHRRLVRAAHTARGLDPGRSRETPRGRTSQELTAIAARRMYSQAAPASSRSRTTR